MVNENHLATIHSIKQLAELLVTKLATLEVSSDLEEINNRLDTLEDISGIDCGEITANNP